MPVLDPLSARLNSLPLIICGPIVRRVDPNLVTVWVALKEAREITLELYSGYQSPADDAFTGKVVAFTSSPTSLDSPIPKRTATIPLGTNLHIGLITIETSIAFNPGAIFSYNLLFFKSTVADSSLISLGMLNEPVQLGFRKRQLPSFVVPPSKLEDLRIAHGSCRKPHGRGRDGLAILAEVMESDFTHTDSPDDSLSRNKVPRIRPHCLFHTGDQIYADDVSGHLMHALIDAGTTLLGVVEPLPFPKLTSDTPNKRFPALKDDLSNVATEINWLDATIEQWPPMRRATNYYSGFSGDEDSHLTSFGDFCAAYLFQWSDVLWPSKLPDPGEVFDARLKAITPSLAQYLLPVKFDDQPDNFDQLPAEEKNKYLDKKRGEFIKGSGRPDSGRVNVLEFKAGLPLVRRVLANVPSIMIFDDHDVTDDWYLTGGWSKRVLSNPLGQTIIRNGLMAFALFQACGNDPKAYRKAKPAQPNDPPPFQLIEKCQSLLSNYRKVNTNSSPPTAEQAKAIIQEGRAINKLLGFDNFADPPVKWHSSFRLGPTKVYVLDTRTRRDFSAGLNFPPNLLGKKALEEQLPDTTLPTGVELAMVVSAAPVLGLAAIETIGQPIVSRVLDAIHLGKESTENKEREVIHKGHESLDVEAWSINQKGFEALLKRCAPLKKVVFLSGDVHYGITTQLDYFQKGQTEASRFVQMVSSSLKNIKPEGQLLGLLPAALTQTALSGGLNREMAQLSLFAWEEENDIKKLVFRFQTEPGKYRTAKAGEFPLRYTYALQKKPVFLALRDWPLAEFQPKDAGGQPVGDQIVHERMVLVKDAPVPNYRWKLSVELDARPDNVRLASLGAGFALDPNADLPTVITDAQYEKRLDTLLKRSAFFSRSHMSRFINWFSHVAIVHFDKKDNVFRALHSQFFQPDLPDEPFDTTQLRYKPGTFQQPYFRHEVSLRTAPLTDQPLIPTEKTV